MATDKSNLALTVKKFAAHGASDPDWKIWKSDFEAYLLTQPQLVEEDEKYAYLRFLGGKELRDVLDSAPRAEGEWKAPQMPRPYTDAILRLDKFYAATANIFFERDKFEEIKQKDDEKFDSYLVRLKQQALRCGFREDEMDCQVQRRISKTARLKKVRIKAYESEVTLEKVIEYAHQQEVTVEKADEKKGQNEIEVNAINANPRGRPMVARKKTCWGCGSDNHMQYDARCRARNMRCNSCQRVGHMAKMCRSVNYSRDTRETNRGNGWKNRVEDMNKTEISTYVARIEIFEKRGNEMVTCLMGDVEIEFLVDSGSPINTITMEVYERLKAREVNMWDIKKNCEREFRGFGASEPLQVKAVFQTELRVKDTQESCSTQVFVIDNSRTCLICKNTGERLNILRVGTSICNINMLQDIKEFPLVPITPVQLFIDDKIPPVKNLYCRVPVAMREKVEAKLKWMIEVKIIEKVDTPASWISPMVVVPKGNDDIRICIDMRQANHAIKRINHVMPCLETLRDKLSGCKVFSKLDITLAYHHIPLDEKSRHITTFMSPMGLLRYTRLVFGINCAPEIFQKIMEELFADFPQLIIYLDDMLLATQDSKTHQEILPRILKRLDDLKFQRNEAKCQLMVNQVDFMGFVITKDGLQISQKKVKVIEEFKRPENIGELRSFLGLMTFVSHFILDYATKTFPLRKLLKNPFEWTEEQQKCFEGLKREICAQTRTLGHFNANEDTFLYTDASKVGIGAVLVQEDGDEKRIISCVARSLTETEQRYPQVQREALAVTWGVKKLHYFLFGKKFTIRTDNNAVKFIFGENRTLGKRACNRADAFALELQSYDFKTEYIEGKKNIADVFSRLYGGTNEEDYYPRVDKEIHAVNWDIATIVEPRYEAITTEEIQKETKKDQELQQAMRAIVSDKWNDDTKLYRAFKAELYENSAILWREDRIVLPKALRNRAMEIAHRGHPGIVTMKRTLRERVWWPNMDNDMERFIKACEGCTLVARTDPPEPLRMSIMPNYPWEQLAIDFFEAPEIKCTLLVIVDYHSRFVVVKEMKGKAAIDVINKLEEVFTNLDRPYAIRADNGPPFASKEFREYCEKKNIILKHSIPLWAQSNGEVEIQNKGIKRALQIANETGKNWRLELNEYLDAYNRRPHSVTNVAPMKLLLKREIKNFLPGIKPEVRVRESEDIRDRDRIDKDKRKLYADERRHAKESSLEVGDEVLMKNIKKSKLTTNFGSERYRVTEIVGKKAIIRNQSGVQTARAKTELKKIKDVEDEPHEKRPKRIAKPNPKYKD